MCTIRQSSVSVKSSNSIIQKQLLELTSVPERAIGTAHQAAVGKMSPWCSQPRAAFPRCPLACEREASREYQYDAEYAHDLITMAVSRFQGLDILIYTLLQRNDTRARNNFA